MIKKASNTKNDTKTDAEEEISGALAKFKTEHIGKGPEEVRSYIIDDMVVIRLRGPLTTLEAQLAEKPEGVNIVKRSRIYILEKSREVLDTLIYDLLKVRILGFYVDVNPQNGIITCFVCRMPPII